MTLGPDDEIDAVALELRVVSGDPTPAELAAVTAVVGEMLADGSDRVEVEFGVSEWNMSRRDMRREHRRGPGAWRGFSG